MLSMRARMQGGKCRLPRYRRVPMNEMTKPPMRSEPHPISGALYTEIGDGLVRVEDKAKGKYGVFKWDGTWIEGGMTYADPHLLKYIGGPDLPPGRDIVWVLLPALES